MSLCFQGMIIRPTTIDGAFVLQPEPIDDERGFFARIWEHEALAVHGLQTAIVQANIAYNKAKGTLRGLHFQRPPHAEVKVVRCTAGVVYDVVLDLRPSSPTYLASFAIELSALNRLAVYVPAGLAHGYQTLTDNTETTYFHSVAYSRDSSSGVRWNDPAFGIEWPPEARRILSENDRGWPDYDPNAPFFARAT